MLGREKRMRLCSRVIPPTHYTYIGTRVVYKNWAMTPPPSNTLTKLAIDTNSSISTSAKVICGYGEQKSGLAIVNLLKYARIALPETKKTGNAGGVDRRAPNASNRQNGDRGRVRSLQKYFALHYSAETRLEKGGTLPLSLSFFLFFSKTLAAAAFPTAALLRLSLFSLF